MTNNSGNKNNNNNNNNNNSDIMDKTAITSMDSGAGADPSSRQILPDSRLNMFNDQYCVRDIDGYQWDIVPATTTLPRYDDSPLSFRILPSDDHFIDPANIFLHLKVALVDGRGNPIQTSGYELPSSAEAYKASVARNAPRRGNASVAEADADEDDEDDDDAEDGVDVEVEDDDDDGHGTADGGKRKRREIAPVVSKNLPVGPINFFLLTMFESMGVYFNQQLVSSSHGSYPFEAHLRALLDTPPETRNHSLAAALWMPDGPGCK